MAPGLRIHPQPCEGAFLLGVASNGDRSATRTRVVYQGLTRERELGALCAPLQSATGGGRGGLPQARDLDFGIARFGAARRRRFCPRRSNDGGARKRVSLTVRERSTLGAYEENWRDTIDEAARAACLRQRLSLPAPITVAWCVT